MTEENPFAAPHEAANTPSLSILQQIAVFLVTFVATVAAFFATCFGTMIVGGALEKLFQGNSAFVVILGLSLIIGLPLIVSAWVLTSVRRAMINTYQNSKKPKLEDDVDASS